MMENQIEIYQSPDGIIFNVQLSNETFWLSQEQLTVLFEKDQSVISRHLINVFKEGELVKESNMQKMHIPNSDKPVTFYNLDVIISVGYRVKSIRGTQFRQWATKRLKDYLTEGLAINEKRLEQKNKEIQVLHDGIRIISRAIEDQVINNENYAWLHQFSVGLQLLDDYDHEALDEVGKHTKNAAYPTMAEYLNLVNQMRLEFNSDVFGREKDEGFDSAINQIMRGFGEQDVYPSIEEKAAMLLYLVIKNHAFVDGNKRIAAGCFLLFLERNGILYTNAGQTHYKQRSLSHSNIICSSE
ncbi:MAG: hypothetical protein RL656_104 [Bacteroidota bacterium]